MTWTDEDKLHERPAEIPAEYHTLSLPTPQPRFSQSRLHNFSFPTVSWGCYKLLRCMNLECAAAGEAAGLLAPEAANHDPRAGWKRPASSTSPEKSRLPLAPSGARDSKEAERRTPEQGEEEESSSSAAAAAAAAAAVRPGNLRTRRAACSAPAENRRPRNPNSVTGSPSPLASEKSNLVSKRVRSDSTAKGEWPKFSIALSREEIEEDFLVFKGKKPPRRPKKRPKIVQRQLDSLFPGLWLSEITPDSYKIDE